VRRGFDLNECWQEVVAWPELGEDEAQIWRLDVERADGSVQGKQALLRECYAVLTGEERERAARMRAGTPREEFVVGRGGLRRLLGRVLDVDARRLSLVTGAHGKPEVPGCGVAFNVAHSRGVVLIALTRSGPIGVDVEYVDGAVEVGDVARSAFAAEDVARLDRMRSSEERLREFYRCWTRREAVAKADGQGLMLEAMPVGLEAETEVSGYFVRGVEVGSCHAGAVATLKKGVRVRQYCFSPGWLLLFED
jgi:4'-phosphopantetheinyl transferase